MGQKYYIVEIIQFSTPKIGNYHSVKTHGPRTTTRSDLATLACMRHIHEYLFFKATRV